MLRLKRRVSCMAGKAVRAAQWRLPISSMLSPSELTIVQVGLYMLLKTVCARQLIVTRRLSWLGLKVECHYHDDKDEDQNPANEEDLNEGCQAVGNVLKLQLIDCRLVTWLLEVF